MSVVPIVLAVRKRAEAERGLGYEGGDIGGGLGSSFVGRSIRAAGVIQRFLRRRTNRARLGMPPSLDAGVLR